MTFKEQHTEPETGQRQARDRPSKGLTTNPLVKLNNPIAAETYITAEGHPMGPIRSMMKMLDVPMEKV